MLGNANLHIGIKRADSLIPISDNIKLLSVLTDNKLKFETRVSDICPKVGEEVNVPNIG